ncbi:hypothetical protein M3Y94_00875600 [Aphelenchoides besseyi]|nr:hypothetical protein M3Y94_00875600 [Aphelenchoides besseyi]KAI6226611.1 hypothetical protein M3Y95_00639000 [Aphelenchoides besseyi]
MDIKSQTCLCRTPLHTGTILIGYFSLFTGIICIVLEAFSQYEEKPQAYNETAGREETDIIPFSAYYADHLINFGIVGHILYYLRHILSVITSIILIYANRKYLPKLYWPFVAVTVFDLILSTFEGITHIVAAIGIRNGAYEDVPTEPTLRRYVFTIILIIAVLELFAAFISFYFITVVLRDKKLMEEMPPLPSNYDNSYSVSYTNNAAEVNDFDASMQPNVPATYRI